jgi:NAD(P)-dependent dehydrogenase (short-subunit alcohol dehydrogenase family)
MDDARKTVLVTGSTDGIGLATAIELARKDCYVIVHGRSSEKAESARRSVIESTANKQTAGVVADFSSLSAVRGMAEDVKSRFSRLDVLIANAGVVSPNRRETEDGYELTFGVNHLAHMLLTLDLLPLLRAASAPHVVVVSSMVHSGGEMDFGDLMMKQGYSAQAAYSRSKLANLLFTAALARRSEDENLRVNALHPGVISTKLLHQSFSGGAPVEQGAETPVYLALSEEVSDVSGAYFVEKEKRSPSPEAEDPKLQERLWEESIRLLSNAVGRVEEPRS